MFIHTYKMNTMHTLTRCI